MPLKSSTIIFFDATQKRRERNKLGQAHAPNGNGNGAAPASNGASAHSSLTNGNGSEHAAKTAVVKPRGTSLGNGETISPAPRMPVAQNRFAMEDSKATHAAAETHAAKLNPAELEQFLINFVVEQTGYPPEIVELDADLEADLGIDSIKKAQLFGELREVFDVTPTDDLRLDDFLTLRHVKDFLSQQPSQNGAVASSKTLDEIPTIASVASPSQSSLSAAELEQFLVNFVVEQTGYPPEIVELDADLEADLGIDSIKKAQLFGELREVFDVTPTDDLRLDDFPTLRHVRDFLSSQPSSNGSPASSQPISQIPTSAPVASSAQSSAQSSLSTAELEQFLVNFVVEQTGYPPEIVELDADLEADLGIDSIKKAQLFGELREVFDVTPTDDLRLDDFPTLRHVRDFLLSARE